MPFLAAMYRLSDTSSALVRQLHGTVVKVHYLCWDIFRAGRGHFFLVAIRSISRHEPLEIKSVACHRSEITVHPSWHSMHAHFPAHRCFIAFLQKKKCWLAMCSGLLEGFASFSKILSS